jgi:hypothetical protein
VKYNKGSIYKICEVLSMKKTAKATSKVKTEEKKEETQPKK